MDPGSQIYLSNNNNKFWSKMIFEQQNQKKFPEKKISEENMGKNKIWGKEIVENFFFEKNFFWKKI